jgi:hypothetical protein
MFVFGKGMRLIFPQIPFIIGDGVARRKMVGHFHGVNARYGCIYCSFPSNDQSVPYDGEFLFFLV